MNTFRIALANLRFPATPHESVTLAEHAIAEAAIERAGLICFPECYIPGYRGMGKQVPPPDPVFLERAWSATAAAGREGQPDGCSRHRTRRRWRPVSRRTGHQSRRHDRRFPG